MSDDIKTAKMNGDGDLPQFDLISGVFDESFDDISDKSENNEFAERKENILSYINENQAKRTKARTVSDMRKVHSFLTSKGETEPIEKIQPDRLDILLAEFFKDVKRDDGNDLEPTSLKGIQYSMGKHSRKLMKSATRCH